MPYARILHGAASEMTLRFLLSNHTEPFHLHSENTGGYPQTDTINKHIIFFSISTVELNRKHLEIVFKS